VNNTVWKIDRAVIGIRNVQIAPKTYDGKKDATVTSVKFTGLRGGDELVINQDYTICDSYFYDANASADGNKVTGTVVLLSGPKTDNYTFVNDGTSGSRKSFEQSAGITRAAAIDNIPHGELTVYNKSVQKYTCDFKQFLPKAPTGEYGTANYTLQSVVSDTGYSVVILGGKEQCTFENGVLEMIFQTPGDASKKTGKVGTITVKVTTTNYEGMILTLDLNAKDKTRLEPGELSCTSLIYGQPLSAAVIQGTMYEAGTKNPVAGKFYWENDKVLSVGDHLVDYVFIADEAGKYETYDGTVTVTVKAKPLIKPNHHHSSSGGSGNSADSADATTLASTALTLPEAALAGTPGTSLSTVKLPGNIGTEADSEKTDSILEERIEDQLSGADANADTSDITDDAQQMNTADSASERTSGNMIWITLLVFAVILAGAGIVLVQKDKHE